MRIAILGASGRTGSTLVEQAVERGHEVVALVRTPEKVAVPAPRQVETRRADVCSPETFSDPLLDDVDVAVSAIGIGKGEGPGALVAGARLLAESKVRTVWLGALGSGVSSRSGGLLYSLVMRMFVGAELAEKAEADQIALTAGATVFHAPDITEGPLSPTRHVVRLANLRRPLLPPRISRATVAALLLDEAETGAHANEIVVPLT
ncbi:NAD(P)-dependent oxidoreductase [Streptomyces formicae]|uniref:NADH-flavin reductase n=1 Tax=Streptomyces formicae TaxID=1616117 RepID=A0A291QCP9_9ACTN|nr:NAD(P)H-binding protein [Streptomyces formicae]ATL29225.1 Putative NADH-flavin reductase [Streptomyces formicae]